MAIIGRICISGQILTCKCGQILTCIVLGTQLQAWPPSMPSGRPCLECRLSPSSRWGPKTLSRTNRPISTSDSFSESEAVVSFPRRHAPHNIMIIIPPAKVAASTSIPPVGQPNHQGSRHRRADPQIIHKLLQRRVPGPSTTPWLPGTELRSTLPSTGRSKPPSREGGK